MIIIGVLSSILSKGKGNKQPSKDKPSSGNSFEEFRTLFQNQLTGQVPEKTNTIQQPEQMEVQASKMRNFEEKYQQMNQDTETSHLGRTKSSTPKQQKRTRAKVTDDKAVDNNSLVSERPDAVVLINGIIWSEILGEPRSKKPYSSRQVKR
jgi:hypothetical protein